MATTKSIGLTGRDYSTLAAYVSYLNGLGTFTDDQIGECYTDSGAIADTSAVTFTGVTKGGYTLTLRAATGQSFRDNASVQSNALKWNASNGAALTNSATAFASTILDLGGCDTVSGLQFKGTASGYIGHLVKAGGAAIENCIVERVATRANVYALYGFASLTNSLVLSGWAGVRCDSTSTLTDVTIAGYNNAAAGSGIRFNHHTNSVVKNVAVRGFTSDFIGTCSASSTNNATDKGSFGGTNFGTSGQVSITSAEWESVTAGSEDFRLAAGSTLLKDNGATTGPTNDIAGTARPQGSSYDIGCWELAAGGGGPTTYPWHYYAQMRQMGA